MKDTCYTEKKLSRFEDTIHRRYKERKNDAVLTAMYKYIIKREETMQYEGHFKINKIYMERKTCGFEDKTDIVCVPVGHFGSN